MKVKCNMFPCQKNIYLYKKSRYRLLYLHKIYYIYYNVITLLCDEFGTITYNSQLLLSFFAWQKRICRQIFLCIARVCD